MNFYMVYCVADRTAAFVGRTLEVLGTGKAGAGKISELNGRRKMEITTCIPEGFIAQSPKDRIGDCAQKLETSWMLLTAGNPESGPATMTISWGGFGYLWHKSLAFVVVRKSRHTLPYIEQNNAFSLSLFDEQYRDRLTYCGRVSGVREDKIAHCGFTTAFSGQVPFFIQARTVLVCSVMYAGDIEEAKFMQPAIFQQWYTTGEHAGDMHRFFCASVDQVLQRP